jgi:hypothetical protein
MKRIIAVFMILMAFVFVLPGCSFFKLLQSESSTAIDNPTKVEKKVDLNELVEAQSFLSAVLLSDFGESPYCTGEDTCLFCAVDDRFTEAEISRADELLTSRYCSLNGCDPDSSEFVVKEKEILMHPTDEHPKCIVLSIVLADSRLASAE